MKRRMAALALLVALGAAVLGLGLKGGLTVSSLQRLAAGGYRDGGTLGQPAAAQKQTTGLPESTPDGNGSAATRPPSPLPADRPATTSRVVYLTFDDGPNTVFTPLILDILRDHGVKATFMVVGRNAQLNPGVLRRIREEGHAVGNHSYSHDYGLFGSPAEFAADLERAEAAIASVTGVRPRVYRPPGGPHHLTPACREILRARGYRVVAWNVTSADTDPNGVTPEQLVHNVVEGVRHLKKDVPAIVLMHDGTQTGPGRPAPGTPGYIYLKNREATVAALPVIIRQLEELGCTFRTLDE
jgi:peptidoglycan/xylan/chitin deacetylase (PgdA/CDA1 family)